MQAKARTLQEELEQFSTHQTYQPLITAPSEKAQINAAVTHAPELDDAELAALTPSAGVKLYGGKAYLRVIDEFELAVRLRIMRTDADSLKSMAIIAAGGSKNPNWEEVVRTS